MKYLSRIPYAPAILFFFLVLSSVTGRSVADEKGPLQPNTPPPIHYIVVEGIINPVVSEFIAKGLDDAQAGGAGVVVLQLDTPGGLDLSMRDIIKAIFASEVPVVVYVAPAGGRAASAGVFITYAAHIAAMAPGTNIGSAHPVAIGGGKLDETMVKKVENDAVAYIRSIAKKRKRNAEWAEKAVRESVNITAGEALELKVIDIIADSRTELFKTLDGRRVETVRGVRVIRTEGAVVVDVEMNLRSRILRAISNPNVAYILMMIGLMGIYFELSNPGVILPGVLGAICLVLAFYSFQALPVNYAGLILIGLSLVFFFAETQVVSFGLLTMAGVVSLVLGSLMLFKSPLPFMRLSIWVLLPTVILMTLFVLGTTYLAVTVHRRRPVSGVDAMVGEEGTVVEDIGGGERNGKVFVAGEYWDASSDAPVERGAMVKVVGVDGMVLKVIRK